MTLDEAIVHLTETLADNNHKWSCEECKEEHEDLLGYLQELKTYREESQKDLGGFLHYARKIKRKCEQTSRVSCEKGKCKYSDKVQGCIFNKYGQGLPFEWDIQRKSEQK